MTATDRKDGEGFGEMDLQAGVTPGPLTAVESAFGACPVCGETVELTPARRLVRRHRRMVPLRDGRVGFRLCRGAGRASREATT